MRAHTGDPGVRPGEQESAGVRGRRARTASGVDVDVWSADTRALHLRSLYAGRRTLMGLVRDLHLISSDPIRSCECVFPDW